MRSARVPESAYTFCEPADEVLRAHQWVGSQPQRSKLVKPAPKLRMNPIIMSARKAPAIVILRIKGRATAWVEIIYEELRRRAADGFRDSSPVAIVDDNYR